MTCCVVYKEDNKIYLAGDKQGSNGNTKRRYKHPKVFKNGKFHFGYTTSFRLGQLLEHHWEAPEKRPSQTEDTYIFVSVLNSIKRLFKEDDFDKDGNCGGTFIMVYNNRMFVIYSDYQFVEIDDFAAIGCGEDEAEAVLYTLDMIDNNLNPEDKLKLAIEVSSFRKCGISSECDIIVVEG
jgi:ATP-dependent protease HslVU (ClpYQ) peptidase subunit